MAVVLVTGCSSGIGLATAIHFAKKGHQVFAGARTPLTCRDLLAARDAGLPLTPIALDVCHEHSVRAAVELITSLAPQLDVLVNNAGISATGPIEDAPLEDARRLMETNYFGAMRLTQTFLPQMRARRGGAIINVSSQAGRRPFALLGHYCASKYALGAATEVLAHEVIRFGIRVALVEPGIVRTPLFAKSPPPPDTGPYAPLAKALAASVEADLAEGSRPEDVAAVIEEAAFTAEPRLHYLVGAGAERNVRSYAELGGDGFVQSGRLK